MTGSITVAERKPFIHIHASISKEEFTVFGGHVIDAFSGPDSEYIINPLSSIIQRTFDETLGIYTIAREENIMSPELMLHQYTKPEILYHSIQLSSDYEKDGIIYLKNFLDSSDDVEQALVAEKIPFNKESHHTYIELPQQKVPEFNWLIAFFTAGRHRAFARSHLQSQELYITNINS